MAITYGDHLVNIGYGEPTPEQENAIIDARSGPSRSMTRASAEGGFTPGEWSFYELPGKHQDGCGYIRTTADDLEISHHGDMGRPREVNLANARLIAAAPDLADCVIRFLEKYEDMESADLFKDLPGEEAQRVVAARKALARATGEQP